VERVLPSAQDEKIACRVVVRITASKAFTIAPGFHFNVPVTSEALSGELDTSVRGEAEIEPQRMVVSVLFAKLSFLEKPTFTRL
jgi:hypothetical protein